MSPYVKADTLCWGCLNACDNGCSWSESLTPVEGWAAERTYTIDGEEYTAEPASTSSVRLSPAHAAVGMSVLDIGTDTE